MYHFAEIDTLPEVSPRDNILIIHSNSDLLKSRLQLLDFCDLHFAQTGQKALEALQAETSFQLLISDLSLLINDDYNLLRFLKTSEFYRNVPIVNLIPVLEEIENISHFSPDVRYFFLNQLDTTAFAELVKDMIRLRTRQSRLIRSESVSNNMLSAEEIQWLDNLKNLVEVHLGDTDYYISQLAHDLHISESTLVRKVKDYMRTNPGQYITQMRMKKAKQMLVSQPEVSVSRVASMVGFKHLGSFSRCFTNHFGISPSRLIKNHAVSSDFFA